MEYHTVLTEACPGPEVIQEAMVEIDPKSVEDLDMSCLSMRISFCVTVTDLIDVLQQAD